MRRIARSTVGWALAGGLVAAGTVLAGVDRTQAVLGAYLVFVSVLLAAATARIAGGAFPRPRGIVPRIARPRRPAGARPDSLGRIEDVVALAAADPFDLHFRLRPILAEAAAAGLESSRGIDLGREPARAHGALSPETWELVRPDRPRPERDDGSKGIDLSRLARIVEELERMLPP